MKTEISKKVCLVTGATGFIGSTLVERLIKDGHEVRIIVRETSDLSNLADVEGKYVKFIGDVTLPETLEQPVKDVNWVFHVAGLIAAPNYETYAKVNVTGTENIFKAVQKFAGSSFERILLVSSMAAGRPSTKHRISNEDEESKPHSVYGKSKAAGENALIALQDADGKNWSWTICRPPAVFGPREKGIYEVFKAIKMGLSPVFGFTPIMRFNLVFVNDLIDGFIIAISHPAGHRQKFYIADSKIYKLTEVSRMIKKAMGKKFTIPLFLPIWLLFCISHVMQFFCWLFHKKSALTPDKVREFAPRYWTCDTSKASYFLNWEAPTNLEDAIAQTVAWYKKNSWL